MSRRSPAERVAYLSQPEHVRLLLKSDPERRIFDDLDEVGLRIYMTKNWVALMDRLVEEEAREEQRATVHRASNLR